MSITMLQVAPTANGTKSILELRKQHYLLSFLPQTPPHLKRLPLTLLSNSPSLTVMTPFSQSRIMIVPKWRYSFHATKLSQPKELWTCSSHMSFPDSDAP